LTVELVVCRSGGSESIFGLFDDVANCVVGGGKCLVFGVNRGYFPAEVIRLGLGGVSLVANCIGGGGEGEVA
jgi:hypothetical protein